jgi:hypothetical protein
LCRSAGDSWIANSLWSCPILSCNKIIFALWTSENWALELWHSPIGRGFFGGRGVKEQVLADSVLVLIQSSSQYHFFLLLPRKSFLGLHQNLFLSSLTDLTLTCQHGIPRFALENLERNKQIYLWMEELATKHQCSPAQLALAWVLHQGDDVVPIPGVTL